MTWAVVFTDTAWRDFQKFNDIERGEILDDLGDWTEPGPPRGNQRLVGGATVFEDLVASGYLVTYFLGDPPSAYIAIIRVRRTQRPGPAN